LGYYIIYLQGKFHLYRKTDRTCIMSQPIDIRAQDYILQQLPFKSYRYTQERQAVKFSPNTGEPQTMLLHTPWGAELVVEKGDYIVNEIDTPDNRWSVQQDIFESTYVEIQRGIYIKRAVVHLYPLRDFTKDPEQLVRVHTLEGVITVRSGDFYLARGIKGEIWPMPNDKVETSLILVEKEQPPPR
jgi:hypothetical protein